MNPTGKERLGELEMRLFAYTQLRKKTIVKTGEIVKDLGITKIQERKLLSRLCLSGLIIRVKRGIYLIPPRIPPGGMWGPGEHLILFELMKAWNNGLYQICGPVTFHLYGFTDQVPNRVYVYNNRIYGDRQIGGTSFSFIKTTDERLGGIDKIETPDGVPAIFSSKARTLVDAVYDWSRFNTLPSAYEWIEASIEKDKKLMQKLAKLTLQFGNQGTIRRIGYLLDTLGLSSVWKKRLKENLISSSSVIPWIPGKPTKGSVDKEWGLIINDR